MKCNFCYEKILIGIQLVAKGGVFKVRGPIVCQKCIGNLSEMLTVWGLSHE